MTRLLAFTLLLLALLLSAPALAAVRWAPEALNAGGCSTFFFAGSDASAAQPSINVPAGELAFSSIATDGTAMSVELYIVAAESPDPSAATGAVLAFTATGNSSSPAYFPVSSGYLLDPEITTDGDGGSVTVCSAPFQMTRREINGRPGTRWLAGTGQDSLAAITGRDYVDPVLGTTSSAGWETCFIDFNDPQDYTSSYNGGWSGASQNLPFTYGQPAVLGLIGTATFDPANLADGAGETTTVTVTGAATGDLAQSSFSRTTSGITITAWVSAANTVSVRFQNESGGALDILSGTLTATVRDDDQAGLMNNPPVRWSVLAIGSPAGIFLNTNRTTGTSNELDARALIGTTTNATGALYYTPLCGFGQSSGTVKREVRAIWRIRRDSGTATNSCFWVGFINTIVANDVPLTVTCTNESSATSNWFGVWTEATADIHVGMNEAAAFTLDYDSGVDTPSSFTSFIIIEMVGVYDSAGGNTWINGYFDFYVNGTLLRQSGRSHSIEPSDMTTPWDIAADPMHFAMAAVRLNTTGGTPSFQVDYVGSSVTRQLQSTTP